MMASNSVTKEYCSYDILKDLKSLTNDLDDIKSKLQEYDDASWEVNYLVSKCMACLTTARSYLVNACDICNINLAEQSDGADK